MQLILSMSDVKTALKQHFNLNDNDTIVIREDFDSELKQIEDKIATLKAELDTLEKQYVEVKTKKQQTQLTTAIAIQLIGKAMSQPYTAIKFKDYNDNKLSIDEICERIKESIEKLGINGIHIGDMSQMLYYRPED